MTKTAPASPAAPGARKPGGLARWLRDALPPALALVAFVGLWQLAVAVFRPPVYLVPGPLNVLQAFAERGGSLWDSTLITLQGATWAFLLSGLLGALFALVMTAVPVLYKSVFPYTVVLQSVPVVAIAPIIIIWFGIGMPSIVVIGMIIAIFPVIANTVIGLRSTDANLKQLFQLYGASPWQTMLKLRLPAALPYFFTGLRIAAGASVIGAIVGEYMAGMGGNRGGLGFLVVEAASRLQMSYLFAAVLCSAALGIAFFSLVSWLSGLFLRSWHESARSE